MTPVQQTHKAADNVEVDPEHGRAGKDGKWIGCTDKFINKTKKRRKKDKLAKASRKKNRKK